MTTMMVKSMLVALVCVLMMLMSTTMVSALTCPRVYECSAIGGSCSSDSTHVRDCNAGLYSRSFYNMTTYTWSCTCSAEEDHTTTPTTAPSYTLGQLCNSTQYWSYYDCVTNPIHGVNEKRWYSQKRIGDVCSSSTAFDCSPPRVCVNGKCQGNLAVGATCWNSSYSISSYEAYGICTFGSFCEVYSQTTGAYKSTGTCIARRAAGESCSMYSATSRQPCANGLDCIDNGSGSSQVGVCGRRSLYFLEGGAKANFTDQCKSGVMNRTDGYRTCLGYEHLLSLVNVKRGQECNFTSDCGNTQDTSATLSSCRCNGMGSSNTAVCSSYTLSTPAQLIASRAAIAAKSANMYAAGCETQNEHYSYPTDTITNNWCYRFESDDEEDRDTYCNRKIALLNAGVKDCDGSILTYCGALHTMSMSVGVLLALMLAALVGAN